MDIETFVDALHSGLREAWLFAFDATDSPESAPKPEYVCSSLVARKIVAAGLGRQSYGRIKLEQSVHGVATDAFVVPLFPRVRRSIPTRKLGSKGSKERIDIVVRDASVGLVPAARAIVELKISDAPGGIHADLLRNRALMELADQSRPNQLQVAIVGLYLVNRECYGAEAAAAYVSQARTRYQQFARKYLSSHYSIYVDAREMSPPPDDPDDGFCHMVSVSIMFFRDPGQLAGSLVFSPPTSTAPVAA